jgi:DNA-binding MarR family transcriptional regulator
MSIASRGAPYAGPVPSRSGADLALLLLAGFRSLADAATAELGRRGYPDHRPLHDFALNAVAAGADSASDLGRRLQVSKQAAAKTIALLEERGYLVREPDPGDARRKRLVVTARGADLMREGAAVFEDLRRDWEDQLGAAELGQVEQQLRRVVGDAAIRFDTPGWMTSADE